MATKVLVVALAWQNCWAPQFSHFSEVMNLMANNKHLEDSINVRSISGDCVGLRKHEPTNEILVYLIPGNPGLIEYYRSFLLQLSGALKRDCADLLCHVVGNSLGGFEVHAANAERRIHPPPLGLRQQIANVDASIQNCISKIQRDDGITTHAKGRQHRLPVVLVGHSVGAYILMENIAQRQNAQASTTRTSVGVNYEIIGGICLFPTVVDLAKSPKGRIMSPFATLPYFAVVIQWLTYILFAFLPDFSIQPLIKSFTGQVMDAANITKAFLMSKGGVQQALHMARDELLEMTDDKWPDSVWDRSAVPNRSGIDSPNLYFYWGLNDHWIDNQTRDTIIAKRARTDKAGDEGKPHMEIDTHRIPHDFCITPENSRLVAHQVAAYVKDVVQTRISMTEESIL